MSVCFYDRALTEKFKKWTEGTDLSITSPEETRQLFATVLDKTNLKRGSGGIVCMCEEPIPIDALNCYIPGNII